MVLTTLPLCPLKATEGATGESFFVRSIALGLIVLCLPLLTGCGDGGNSGNDSTMAMAKLAHGNKHASTSTISLSPSGLAISATQGGSDPAAQTVTISNSGTGTLNWSVSTTAGWLSLSASSGAAPASFTA